MTLRQAPAIAVLAAAGLFTSTETARSYATLGSKWPDGYVVMHLHLGSSSGTLHDGATSWGQSAEWAMSDWNPYIDRVSFRVVRDSTYRIADGNGINNVYWSSTVYGRPFPDVGAYPALAVATRWTRGSTRTEGDIVFNTAYNWNSYRGNLWSGSAMSRAYDFHRVAIHELGHVLGLDHPDEYGQNHACIMHSHTTDLDHITADDVTGAQALYSLAGNGTVAFPPRNESLAFRSELEAKYRDQLRRGAITTYVDNEGDIVWTSEYFRYRVNGCSHNTAITKVWNQIEGNGILGVCANAPAGQVNFPPRNEALDFRNQLESKYRYELQRGPNTTRVDNEGDVVWTQEYLRYRVNNCGHGDAVQRVFLQIEGYGIQPVCR